MNCTTVYKYHHSTKLYMYQKSLLPPVTLGVHSMSNNANGNEQVVPFSGIAWYYGNNDFIIRTFDFIARSDTAHVTCSKKYGFLKTVCTCKASPLTPIHLIEGIIPGCSLSYNS